MSLAPTTSVGGGTGAMTQLSDTVAGGAVASFDVQAISGSYTHLLCIFEARGDTAAGGVVTSLRLNNDSGANYYGVNVAAQGATPSSAEQVGTTSLRMGSSPAATGQANSASAFQFLIRDYAATVFTKLVTGTGGSFNTTGASGTTQEDVFGSWNNTAAVTRLTIFPASGNFVAGSRLSIYGII